VSTRRATAAWRLFRDWLPKKRAGKVKKWLKKIRRAAGEARDLDVLAVRLRRKSSENDPDVLPRLAKRREEVQSAIVRVAEQSRSHDRLQRKIDRLLSGIKARCRSENRDPCGTFRELAQGRMAELAGDFFQRQPSRDVDPAELHQFRIRAKALRYAMELLAPAFGEEFRDQLYPIVEELQERLGHINDHATAADRLRKWSEAECDEAERLQLISLAENELQELDDELRDFHKWWTAERAESLRSGLMPKSGPPARTVLV
jgi:CHAD domain-containing protein